MIGRIHAMVLDCSDPEALAAFYAELTGLRPRMGSSVSSASPADWVALVGGDGQPRLCFQRVPDFRPPRWPDPAFPQQAHLDVEVDDIAVAERAVLALGAVLLRDAGGTRSGFRIYADPAGHPFCLVWGQD